MGFCAACVDSCLPTFRNGPYVSSLRVKPSKKKSNIKVVYMLTTLNVNSDLKDSLKTGDRTS
jgi:hypothetical protein